MVDAKKIKAGSLWRHKKRGSVYRVIDGSAQVQAPEDSGLTDYEVVVVYQSKAGETWVRRHSEFLDGRFEKLSEPPSKEWQTRMASAEDGHEVGAGATLSLAGEDAGLPCHADQVAEIERRLMRNLGYENSHSHKVAFDQFANELHRMWSEDYRSLSLRVEAEKRAREEAERWKGILHKQVDDFAERYAQAGQDANKLRVDLRSAETHSAALARALEEAKGVWKPISALWSKPAECGKGCPPRQVCDFCQRELFLGWNGDYVELWNTTNYYLCRERSEPHWKHMAEEAARLTHFMAFDMPDRARSLLAPKEDTDAE